MALEGKWAAKTRISSATSCARAMLLGTILLSSFLLAAKPVMAADTSGTATDANLRAADDSENVQFALTLNLRNQDQLDRELKDIYNPSSPHYHHFLSAPDFISKYAPSKDDYAALEAFAAKHGLKVTGEHVGHTMLNVAGSTAAIRGLFKTQMYWRQTTQGKRYLASDAAPAAPSDLSSLGGSVAGLNQKPLKPFVVPTHAVAGSSPSAGSGPDGLYVPADIKTTYHLNSIQNGGEPVALVEFSSANYSDAAVYASQFGLHNPTLTQIAVDGGTTDTADQVEVMLDIEMVMAVSNPTNIYIYTAPDTFASGMDLYTKIADDDLVGQVSSSWGLCEADILESSANQENTIFRQMAAEGIAVFAASGDYGADGCGGVLIGVEDPASQPYVTGVGGTSLTTTASQTYASESVWYVSPEETGLTGGSGGGVSMYWPIPSYQTNVTPQSSQFSRTMRNVPDVALDADPDTGYYVYCSACNGEGGAGWGGWGGTSAAAPQWAAMWSLISRGLTNTSGLPSRAGFANPAIYAIGENASEYALAFHDVTTGENGAFNAVPGYDDATGWGSYNGAGLYQAVIAWKKKRISIAPVINYILKNGR